MSDRTVMLSAGGTGGHLFPALALAQELKRRGWEVDLITDMRGDRYGTGFPARDVYKVPAATLASRSPVALARLAFVLARGIWSARGVLRRVRPAAIAGFGGYPTFPPIIAAKLCGVPALVHEQNAVMGRANRVLQRFATVIALSFEKTRYVPEAAAAKSRFTGIPVRDKVIAAASAPYRTPGKTGKFQLVIFGGSQGARYFSETLPPALALLPDALKKRLNVVQQCREEDIERVDGAYRKSGITAELATFFADLPERLAAAHLVVARAGASTVAELAVLGRPAILVPFSHALDNDQLENATRLQQAGGAWCLPERELSAEKLSAEIERLMTQPGQLVEAAKAARNCGKPSAVSLLADEVERLAGREH